MIKLINTSKKGLPDLLLIKDGKVSFVEVKSVTGKIGDLQRLRAKELRDKGCSVRFVTEGDKDILEGAIKQSTEFNF